MRKLFFGELTSVGLSAFAERLANLYFSIHQ